MAKKPNAGDLFYSVAFFKREDTNPDFPEDYGNVVSGWVEQFRTRAAYIHLRGGEQVLAGRLQGKHTQVIRVRAHEKTRSIQTDWYVQDVRSGTKFAVRDVTPGLDRQFIDILCESGVAL